MGARLMEHAWQGQAKSHQRHETLLPAKAGPTGGGRLDLASPRRAMSETGSRKEAASCAPIPAAAKPRHVLDAR